MCPGDSFVESVDSYDPGGRFIQSATVKAPHRTEFSRSKTTIGNTKFKKEIQPETDQIQLADVELEKPTLPAALYFTRGDGSFITGNLDFWPKFGLLTHNKGWAPAFPVHPQPA